MHTLICRSGDRWTVLLREHATVSWCVVSTEASGRLREAIDGSFSADPLEHEWTFSERQASEIMDDLLDAPEQTLTVAQLKDYVEIGVDRALDLMIFTPEGRFADNPGDRWAVLHRPPRQRLWSSGLGGAFRPQTLRQQILEGFFGFQSDEWKSFIGGKHGIDKPSHRRELWVRPAWRARQLCPAGFPEFKPGPVVSDEQRARQISRMPQNKAAARRLKHQEADARFKAESAARRALRGEVA